MKNTFNLSFTPIKPVISKNGVDFDILLKLTTPTKAVVSNRAPLNVCFSIDVSGSMNEPSGTGGKETVVAGYWQRNYDKPNIWPQKPWSPDIVCGSSGWHGNNNEPFKVEAAQNCCPGPNYYWVPERRFTTQVSKLERVVDAVIDAVAKLTQHDRFSIVVFSNQTRVVLESDLATKAHKDKAITVLKSLNANGGTALHAGWKEAAEQVCNHLTKGVVNRVLLLTDGEANVGIKDSDTLSSHTNGLAGHNVSTSTFGVGSSYNEDLLQSMADAGDGQYYYLDEPDNISAKFEEEFSGLSQLFAKSVKLELSTNTGEITLLNELPIKDGYWTLPNGINGQDQYMVARIKVPAAKGAKALKSLVFDAKVVFKNTDDAEVVVKAEYSVPFATQKAFETSDEHADVAKRVLALEAAKAKRAAMAALDSGNYAMSKSLLRGASDMISASAYGAAMGAESMALNSLCAMADDGGDMKTLRKEALFQSYSTTRSKS